MSGIVTVRCFDGKELEVPRKLLMDNSEALQSMLESQFKEGREQHMETEFCASEFAQFVSALMSSVSWV